MNCIEGGVRVYKAIGKGNIHSVSVVFYEFYKTFEELIVKASTSNK